MHLARLMLRALVPCLLVQVVLPQELPFDIPVQLIGFPIIILAVRLSNFLKKLSYAVNPSTYRSRARRGSEHAPIDISDIEKKLIHEMGDKVCVYEDVCMEYADKVNNDQNFVLDWQDIFRHYEKFPRGKKEFYLLSVFMGDIVKSRDLCSQLAKRGRSCNASWSNTTSEGSLNNTAIKHGDHLKHQNASGLHEYNHQNKSLEQHDNLHVQSSDHQVSSSQGKNHHKHHATSHHQGLLKPNQSDPNTQLKVNSSQVHQTIHRHHVEVHLDESNKQHGILMGENPPHHIHHSSRRVNS